MLLASRDDVPLARIQEVLRTDAAFAAEVLRLANSPLFKMRGRVNSVMQAVVMLGLDRIQVLATTLALRTFLTSGKLSDAMRGCWRHNLATAILCERLARLVHMDRDICYTAGLLHDIGRLALLRKGGDEYERMLSREDLTDLNLIQFEKSAFDIDHGEAGAWILEEWQFPKELCDIAALHHRRPNRGTPGLLPIVYAAWRMADMLGFSVQSRPVPGDIAEIAAVLPDKAARQTIEEFDGIAEVVAFKINVVECSFV